VKRLSPQLFQPLVSIIIRTRNEERWIGACLRAVFSQTYRNFEVVLVDNNSTDKTVAKASAFDIKLVTIDEFRPGDAINRGIAASNGEIVVCVSGHCIPTNENWLQALVANLDDDQVAGVYGRQEPMAFTPDLDKRDLMNTFGLDRRVQVKDSFFHNANSAIRRSVWNEIPFDAEVSNIEDRVWAEAVLGAGYTLVYEPDASVFHHHGIHHEQNPERCASVVRILENLGNHSLATVNNTLEIENLNIVAVIPVRDEDRLVAGRHLYEYTIEHARNSRYIKQIVVSTNDETVRSGAIALGADVPFMRDEKHSRFDVILEQVMQYTLKELEDREIFPDILVMMEITYPFRNGSLIDDMIRQLVTEGLDTVVPARKEYNSCWIEKDGSYQRIDHGHIPRQFKQPTYTGLKGLGCVTHAATIREGRFFGTNVGMYEISDSLSCIEARSCEDCDLAEAIINSAQRGEIPKAG
jgi:glycosyltransferase involved in cell wall biosynthesis